MAMPDDTQDDAAKPARSRLRPSGRAIAIGAGLAVAAASAIITVGLLTRGDPEGAPGASAGAGPTLASDYGDRLVNDAWTVDWSATFDPSVGVVPLLSAQAPTSFDDGLSEAELGAVAPRNSPRLPPAYVATEAIWDRVGEGWGVAVFGPSGSTYLHQYAGFLDVPAEFYLVSPEGHYFRMWSAWPPYDPTGFSGRYPIYTITGVYPELGWIALGGYFARAESETPGYVEVRDLHTGELLTQGWAGGEGDSRYGTDRQVVGPLADGSWFWADITVTEDDSTSASATLVDADGHGAPVALPDASFYGSQFTRIDAAGTAIALSGGGEFYGPGFLYLFDVATGEWSDATDLVVGPDRDCYFSLPNDDASFYAVCGESYEYVLIGYDGSMTPTSQDAVWEDYATSGWEGTGFDPTVEELGEGWGEVHSFRDVASGTAKEVLTEAQCGVGYDLPVDPPVSLGGERFAFHCEATNLLAAYDRSTGATFALAPAVIPDTGARSGLADFVAYPTESVGSADAAAAPRVDGPGATAVPGPGIVLLSAPVGAAEAPGSVASVASDDYPESTPYTPEILAQVGDLWRIETYGTTDAREEPSSSVYLTSPQGTRYLVLTDERQLTPVVWDQPTQRVLLLGGFGHPPEVLDLRTGALMAPYGDADADAAFWGGDPAPLGLGADGRYYWIAATDSPSPGVFGMVVLAWSGAKGRETVATLPSVWQYYALDNTLGGGDYFAYQTESATAISWVRLSDPTDTGTIGTLEGNDYCTLQFWQSRTELVYSCGIRGDDTSAPRVWDFATGTDREYAPLPSPIPPEELAAIYGTFQLPGTPLVIRTDGRDGNLVGASVLTTEGLQDLAEFDSLEPFKVGEIDALRPGTYLVHESAYDYWGPGSGDRTVAIDVVAGLMLTPDLPPPPGPDYSRALTSSVLVYLAGA